jgi:CspA family cold shock protein
MPEYVEGTVKWFNDDKGFGFIKPDSNTGKDIFVHISQIRKSNLITLTENQRVRFRPVEGRKGLEAEDISQI